MGAFLASGVSGGGHCRGPRASEAVRVILTAPNDEIRSFADAFRVRKD
jgi:hypothetical protein